MTCRSNYQVGQRVRWKIIHTASSKYCCISCHFYPCFQYMVCTGSESAVYAATSEHTLSLLRPSEHTLSYNTPFARVG